MSNIKMPDLNIIILNIICLIDEGRVHASFQ